MVWTMSTTLRRTPEYSITRMRYSCRQQEHVGSRHKTLLQQHPPVQNWECRDCRLTNVDLSRHQRLYVCILYTFSKPPVSISLYREITKLHRTALNWHKGKGRILIQRCLRDERTSALYNLGSGSWLARANGAAAQIAVIQLHALTYN